MVALVHDVMSCLTMRFNRGIHSDNSLAAKELHLNLISDFWDTHVGSCMVVVLNGEGSVNANIDLQLGNDTWDDGLLLWTKDVWPNLSEWTSYYFFTLYDGFHIVMWDLGVDLLDSLSRLHPIELLHDL